MTARLLAFVVWAAAAAALVHWALRLGADAPPVPAHATPVALEAAQGDWVRVLGGAGAAEPATGPEAALAPADPRLRLLGVVAPQAAPARQGIALISVDDGPPRALRVGAVVVDQTVLQSVHRHGATLGPAGGAAEFELELPPEPPPAAARAVTRATPAPAPPARNPAGFGRPTTPPPVPVPRVPETLPQPLPPGVVTLEDPSTPSD